MYIYTCNKAHPRWETFVLKQPASDIEFYYTLLSNTCSVLHSSSKLLYVPCDPSWSQVALDFQRELAVCNKFPAKLVNFVM
jgi:hypothetical protein